MTLRYKSKFLKGVAVFTATSLLSLPLLTGLSQAQDGDVFNRLSRIEREIDTLSRSVYRGETPPPPSNLSQGGLDNNYRANLEVRLNAIEEQMRTLTGRIEENQYKIDQLQQRFDTFSSDVEVRLNENARAQMNATPASDLPAPETNNTSSVEIDNSAIPEATENMGANADAPLDPEGSSTVKPLATDAATLYENAYTALQNNDVQEAQDGFTQFLEIYPEDKLASNARYWLAETYYVENQYEDAAREFAAAYKKDPKGSKAQDNLLKLALSLKGLDRDKDACVALAQLNKEFGITNSAVVQRGAKERANLACE